jgi:hypothetical protein
MGGSEPSSPFGRCGKDYAAPSKGAAAGRNRSLRMRAAGPLPPKTKRIPPFLDTDETHNRTHALLSHLRHSYLGYQDCTHPNPIIERCGASVPPTLLAGMLCHFSRFLVSTGRSSRGPSWHVYATKQSRNNAYTM